MLDYFRKLYSEGLLDVEFLTHTQPAWSQRMSLGKSFISYDWIGRLDEFSQNSTIEGYDLRYGNPVGPNQTLVTLAKIAEGGCVIANNDKAGLAMKVMDFMYSDAGAELCSLGIKGQTYELLEDGSVKYLGFEDDEVITLSDLSEKYSMLINGMYRRVDKRCISFKFTEREQEAQDWYKNCKGFEPADPIISFSDKNSNDVVRYVTDLAKKFEEVMFKYIVGTETGDAAWDKWLKEAKKLGEDELCKIYNDRHKELGL